MNKLYVLICENWTGSSYDKELMEIYKDEELAQHTIDMLYKGKTPKCDVSYYVETVNYNDLEV